MKKIVVTGAGAVLGQGIIKSLRAASLPCEILSLDPNPLSAGLYWTDRSMLIPMASDPSYASVIEQILRLESPDAVLVGTDVELDIFAKHRHAWESKFGTKILVSDENVVEIADDKFATVEFLERHGLSHPQSVRGEDDHALAQLIEDVGFPLIVKPRRGARAVGVSMVHDVAQLTNALAGRSNLIVQQMAGEEDQEFTAGVVYFDGAVQASIILRRDLRDGNTYRAYSGDFSAYREYVHDIASALKPHGPANFQFRVDGKGVPRLFEINARFSGTTPMRAIFGFNEVDLCLRKLLLNEDVVEPKIREGTVVRFLEEQFIDERKIPWATER
ncbi:ATP-grasp domain-containing protein [Sphingopyxis sp.]|uniref:ATP-grasp domain-containing protein n=1 Tax=Sphingopyxis sp. TaxID=1908224 RepID=UPI003D0B28FB